MLKEICYCGHPKERHIADKGELNEFRRAKHFGKEANPVKTFHDCYHCVCKEYALDEQYTKQEEETVKEQFCKVCHHQILGNGMCFGCTHDCSNGYTTPTSTNIPASSTPIVEECCGCYKLMPKDECRGECMCHTSNKKI